MKLPPDSPQAELIRSAIKRVAVGPDRGRDISRAEARQIGTHILRGETDPLQAAVFLIALRMKRESMEEYIGLFDALQEAITPVAANVEQLYCLADPFDGFLRTNTVTPFIAPVLAACGMPALMHGVESVGPKYGVTAQQVYRMAGIDTGISQQAAVPAIERAGWCYIDQSQYAPELYALRELRDRVVKRTAITTLERLLMPLQGQAETHMVLGYVHRAYPEIYATLAQHAGYNSILLFKGVEGGLAPAMNKPQRRYFVQSASPLPIRRCKQVIEQLPVFCHSNAAPKMDGRSELAVRQCLQQGVTTLSGEHGMARNSLCMAAAHILHAHGHANSFPAAVVKVQNSLDNGLAKAHFDILKDRY